MTNNGTVAMWHKARAFGFIKPDNGQADIFCHVTQLAGVPRGSVPDPSV